MTPELGGKEEAEEEKDEGAVDGKAATEEGGGDTIKGDTEAILFLLRAA